MNLTAILTEINDVATGHADDPVFESSRMIRAVNRALRRYERERDWGWLTYEATVTTSAGTDEYALPSGHLKTYSLTPHQQGAEPLRLFSPGMLDERWPRPLDQGEPVEFAVVGDELRLRPVPDDVYEFTHRYKREEPELSTGSDEPLIPEAYIDIVVLHAAADLLRQANDPRAQDLADDARMVLRQMADDIDRSDGPRRRRVRNRGFL